MPMPDFTQPAGMVPPTTSAGAAAPQSQGFDWDSLFKALGQFQAPSGHQFSPVNPQLHFGGGLLPPVPTAPMQRPEVDMSGIQGLMDLIPKGGAS